MVLVIRIFMLILIVATFAESSHRRFKRSSSSNSIGNVQLNRNAAGRNLLLYKINEDKAIYIIDKMRKISLEDILGEKSSKNSIKLCFLSAAFDSV